MQTSDHKSFYVEWIGHLGHLLNERRCAYHRGIGVCRYLLLSVGCGIDLGQCLWGDLKESRAVA